MYLINTDCSIEPFNPGGILAWAYIAKSVAGNNRGEVWKGKGISGRGEGMTNNMGEYHAVIAALRWALGLPETARRPIIIQSDSMLIVNQCNGSWQVKDEKLIPLHSLVQRAIRRYGRKVTLKWVPREQNAEVDALSRTAYDQDELEEMRRARATEDIWGDDNIPF
jgi:ribonuclease HI